MITSSTLFTLSACMKRHAAYASNTFGPRQITSQVHLSGTIERQVSRKFHQSEADTYFPSKFHSIF